MLKICLVFWESEPQYAYKLYAYKKKHVFKDGQGPLLRTPSGKPGVQNWEDPWSRFGVKCKEVKKQLFWTLNPL